TITNAPSALASSEKKGTLAARGRPDWAPFSASRRRSYNRSLWTLEQVSRELRAAAPAAAATLWRRVFLVRVHAPRQHKPPGVALATPQGLPDEPRQLAVLSNRTFASERIRVQVWHGGRMIEVWMPIVGGGLLVTTHALWQPLGQFSVFEFGLCSHSTLLNF